MANDQQIPERHLGNQIVLLQCWSKLPRTLATTLTRLPNPCASSELQGRERLGNWFPLYHRILPPVQWEPFNQTKTAVHPSNRPTTRSTWILQKDGLFATPSRSARNPIDMAVYPIQDLFECIQTFFTPRNRSCTFKFTKILKPRNVRTKQMLFNRASKCQTSKCI